MTKPSAAALVAAVALSYAAGCGGGDTAQPARAAIQYPEPRYPSYLKPPASIDEVLPHVRPLVRNKIGFQGAGLGVAQPGDTVTFVLGPDAEDLIVQAVKTAMEDAGGRANLGNEDE